MSNTIVVTSIYEEFWGTQYFRQSCKRLGLPIHNAFKGKRFAGNGNAMKMIGEAYEQLKDQYPYTIYSDGADTLFLKNFEVPKDRIIFSAEKAVWPPIDELKRTWENYYVYSRNKTSSPWRYLNAGNVCGPTALLAEFYNKYGLLNYDGKDANGQGEIAWAFFKARMGDDFPIELDTECKYFQTTAFEDPGDFYSDGKTFQNMVTGTEPCILHGNGRTDMTWIYQNLTK